MHGGKVGNQSEPILPLQRNRYPCTRMVCFAPLNGPIWPDMITIKFLQLLVCELLSRQNLIDAYKLLLNLLTSRLKEIADEGCEDYLHGMMIIAASLIGDPKI